MSDAIVCQMMLPPLRSVFIALLPFQPQLQSAAAGFFTAQQRSVSSPSGGLSSRQARFSVAALFGFQGGSDIYYFIISFDSSSTVLGYLQSGPVSDVSEKNKDTCTEISPAAGARHRPPPTRFPPVVMNVLVPFSILHDTF